MATLENTEFGILGQRERWILSNGLTVIASKEGDQFVLYISGMSVIVISTYLKLKFHFHHALIDIIDGQALFIKYDEKEMAIKLIEQWPN